MKYFWLITFLVSSFCVAAVTKNDPESDRVKQERAKSEAEEKAYWTAFFAKEEIRKQRRLKIQAQCANAEGLMKDVCDAVADQ